MPTWRKPIRAIKARLAVFSGKMREDQLPESGFRRRIDQGSHRDATGSGATLPAGNVDREFRYAGVAGPIAVDRAQGERKHRTIMTFDDHDRMAVIEQAPDLLGRAWFGLEGGDAIGNPLVVNRGDR